MEETGQTNPLIIGVLFILRCIVPMVIMFGLSYILRRLGVIAPPPEPPPDWDHEHNSLNSNGGGVAHAKH